MSDLPAIFLRATREALARTTLAPGAVVTTSVSAELVRVELRQGDLVLAAATIHRVGTRPTERQPALPFAAPTATERQPVLPEPRQLPAPAADTELVELVIGDDRGSFEGLDLFDDARVIAWTWAGKRPDEYLRTIVPRPVADELLRRSKGRIDTERTSIAKGLPSHVLTIGGEAMTPTGPCAILGIVGGPEGDTEPAPGLVIETAEGPRVAWLDAAEVKGAEVMVYPRPAHLAELVNGEWTWRRASDPPVTPKPRKASKATKPLKTTKATAKPKSDEASASHRDQRHDFDAARFHHPGEPFAAWKADDTVQTETRGKGVSEAAWVAHVRELAEAHGTVRVYSRKGVCTWDSRDGSKS